jgi:hypothetical protein
MLYFRGEVVKMRRFLILPVLIAGSLWARDPFLNQEDAVGYIILERGGKAERFIVIEGKDGNVKLIKTRYEPEKVLKKGGKKK